jgi:hypothetical protein
MPGQKGSHTKKAERQAEKIAKSAKKEGRYKGREEEVAWRTVHKGSDPHKKGSKGGSKR